MPKHSKTLRTSEPTAGLLIARLPTRTYVAAMQAPVEHVTVIGLGLIGSSIAKAVKKFLPGVRLSAYDLDEVVRKRAEKLRLADMVAQEPANAVAGADLVILCVPVGSMKIAAQSVAEHLHPATLVSDVGSSKAAVAALLREALPHARIIPAHPVAGNENSGPDAGYPELFVDRWCILTPDADARAEDVARLSMFWAALGARVEIMGAAHHDIVLAMTSHIPHLIAFSMVETASDLERVTQSEIIKYSGGGFRDFTRIAASDPTMWRDIFLTNKEAVLDMLQHFTADLANLQRAIEQEDSEALFSLFTRARGVRRGLVE